MKKQLIIPLILLILSASKPAALELDWLKDFKGENSGHTTCNFLTLPVSPEVLARGAASAPGTMDATDLILFTANSALSDRSKFVISHLEYLMGLRKEYAGALFPIREAGTLGFYTQVFTPGKIEYARDIDEQPSKPSLVEMSLGVSFARALLNNSLNMGISLYYIESKLDKIAGRAMAGSADLLFIPTPWISSRLYFSNIGTTISYGTTDESLPAQAGFSVLLHPIPSFLPFTSKFNLDIGGGVRKMADEPVIAGVSTEIQAGSYFKIFCGYEHTYGRDPTFEGFGFGAGFHKEMYGIDAGWKKYSKEFGPVWSASIKIQLQEKKERTAEEYYLIAENFYRNNRKYLSSLYAVRALKLDPNSWKAHALLARIRSDELRNKKIEISLIYTGSTKDQFLPPPYPGTPGGLARQSSAITTLRNQFPVSFSIQSGNLITSNSHPLKVQLADFYLKHVNFDAVIGGISEIDFGFKELHEKNDYHKLIVGNRMNKDNNAIITHRIIERDGYKIFVGSFTNPAFVNKNRHNELQQFNPKELVPEEASKCDLRILVIHDIWENIVGRAKYFTNVDIIICANLKQHFPSPMKSGSTLILSAGDGGKYLGNLVMRFDENRKLIYTENHLIALLQETGTDTTIKNEIDKISSKIDLQAQGTDQNVVRGNSDGIFTFLSDRDGKTGLYLKMIGKNAEYPLTRQLEDINKPVISFAADRLAFFSKNPQGYGKLMTTDLTGSRSIVVNDSCYLHDAIFSPDGKWLYYAAQSDNKKKSDILKVRIEGGSPQPVIAWDNSAEHSINFSPDNAYMLFCTDRDGPSQIYLTNPAGDRPLRITDENANHVSPVFSPDCQKIAYLTDRSNFGGKLDLWVYDRLSGAHNQITQNSNVKTYCWLSDSKTIVYSSGVNILDLNKVDIILFRFSKLTSNNMLKTYNEKMPTTITLDGKEIVIFERESDTEEKQIFQINPDGTGERCIINSDGNDWLGE